ncbi:hypothetical protein FOCC_FOCC013448 [Frankliniella occidentalis]|nr:hypothetical protein FOCC_FOCC013448 [Frankliniella occidentalis]
MAIWHHTPDKWIYGVILVALFEVHESRDEVDAEVDALVGSTQVVELTVRAQMSRAKEPNLLKTTQNFSVCEMLWCIACCALCTAACPEDVRTTEHKLFRESPKARSAAQQHVCARIFTIELQVSLHCVPMGAGTDEEFRTNNKLDRNATGRSPAKFVYSGLDILTNKATEEERCGVPHHLLGHRTPGDHYNVYQFRNEAFRIVSFMSVWRAQRLHLVFRTAQVASTAPWFRPSGAQRPSSAPSHKT